MTREVMVPDTNTEMERRTLLDIEGVAARLGVTVRHVRRLVADRRIPYLKWGLTRWPSAGAR